MPSKNNVPTKTKTKNTPARSHPVVREQAFPVISLSPSASENEALCFQKIVSSCLCRCIQSSICWLGFRLPWRDQCCQIYRHSMNKAFNPWNESFFLASCNTCLQKLHSLRMPSKNHVPETPKHITCLHALTRSFGSRHFL